MKPIDNMESPVGQIFLNRSPLITVLNLYFLARGTSPKTWGGSLWSDKSWN